MGNQIGPVLAACLAMATGPALADGSEPVPFKVINRSDTAIECAVTLAHWYSDIVGTAQPGGTITAAFRSDPADGTVAYPNVKGEPMPVLALWCGLAGQSIATRFDIVFQRRRGIAEPPIALTCTGVDLAGRLDCRRGEPD